jgi:hypothetical protein
MVEEKMRYILTLALFFTCLPAASAADDPVTKRNNDATLRPPAARILLQLPRRPVPEPMRQNVGPTR